MNQTETPYQKVLLVCTNERVGEASCGGQESRNIHMSLKQYVNDNGLKGTVRVSKTHCLGKCELGPNVMIFPDDIWYNKVSEEDIPEVISRHLQPLADMKVAENKQFTDSNE